jgi:elongation factor G
MDAIGKARAIILEPIVNIEVTAPEQSMGDIAGDLSSRRGQLSGTDSFAPGTLVIKGQVPLSELGNYQARLKSVTAGQGSYTMEFARYEPVPPSVQKALAEQHAKTAVHAEEQ